MQSKLLFYLLLLTPLAARENPFFPTDAAQIQKVTSNIADTKPPLGSISHALPDQSRILKEVSFTVQNVDGSIETHKIDVDKSIDWHKPILLMQGKNDSAVPSTKNSRSSADFGILNLHTQGKSLTIVSSAPLLRHFALAKPNRIVIDFKDEREFSLIEKTLDAAPYVSASVGTHGKFIRATITLDGRYGYTFKRNGNTITIICK